MAHGRYKRGGGQKGTGDETLIEQTRPGNWGHGLQRKTTKIKKADSQTTKNNS